MVLTNSECQVPLAIILPSDKDRPNKGIVMWSNERTDLFPRRVPNNATDMGREGWRWWMHMWDCIVPVHMITFLDFEIETIWVVMLQLTYLESSTDKRYNLVYVRWYNTLRTIRQATNWKFTKVHVPNHCLPHCPRSRTSQHRVHHRTIWWNMFPCIQRFGSLIVPMVRSFFRQ